MRINPMPRGGEDATCVAQRENDQERWLRLPGMPPARHVPVVLLSELVYAQKWQYSRKQANAERNNNCYDVVPWRMSAASLAVMMPLRRCSMSPRL